MRKGFTLIELLGIVIILAIVFSLSFPIYVNLIKNEKDNKAKGIEETLCLAGENYLYRHEEDSNIASFFQNKTSITIQVETLINDNLVDDSLFSNIQNLNDLTLSFSFINDDLSCEYNN